MVLRKDTPAEAGEPERLKRDEVVQSEKTVMANIPRCQQEVRGERAGVAVRRVCAAGSLRT